MSRFQKTTEIFTNEDAVTEDWVPDDLPEREEELDELEMAFMPAVNSSTAHNVFLYGKTGQGKTAATEVILNDLQEHFEKEKEDGKLTVIDASFQDVNTSYQAVGEILTHIEDGTDERPKGLSVGDLNKRMFNALDEIGGHIVLILDEIDSLGTEDDLLYQIPRARSEGKLEEARVSVVGISNDFEFRSNLSPKVKDTLGEVEIHFAPYNANQLQTILRQREEIAFEDGVLEEDVIPLCAAYAAQDKGSARQAIKFLHRAGALARKDGDETVTTDHLEAARDQIEQENIVNRITELTTHDQMTLLALASLEAKGKTPARTKQIYSEYNKIAEIADIEPLTSRSIMDKLPNLDTYSFAITQERTGGMRGGPYNVSELDVEIDALIDSFQTVDRFDEIASNLPLGHRQSKIS